MSIDRETHKVNVLNALSSYHVVIIGAGFSGTLVATHLLSSAQSPLKLALIEQSGAQLSRGVAYSTAVDCHLLNVPAGNMSAFPDQPEHFLCWAQRHENRLVNPPWVTAVTAASFLPRRAYGDYLADVIDQAQQATRPGVGLTRRVEAVVGVSVDQAGVNLCLRGGDSIRAQRVVLALGNFHPGDPWVSDPSFYQTPRYYGDPWAGEALRAVAETDSCLLVGSGLTMVDWAIALAEADYRGTIHTVSRRGLWPKGHRASGRVPFGIDLAESPLTVRGLLQQIRRQVRIQSRGDTDWRSVIDSLRPYNPQIWQQLPQDEQRRFLRHVRPYWDCHRHRLAPSVAERLQALAASGQLVRHAGRIQGYRVNGSHVAVSIRERGGNRMKTVSADAVVNCSGSESDYRKLDSPLVCDLLRQGLGCPDPLALGLNVDLNGALIDVNGKSSDRLFTLGPPQKGMFWETTAVPEIRVQAARLAERLLGS